MHEEPQDHHHCVDNQQVLKHLRAFLIKFKLLFYCFIMGWHSLSVFFQSFVGFFPHLFGAFNHLIWNEFIHIVSL